MTLTYLSGIVFALSLALHVAPASAAGTDPGTATLPGGRIVDTWQTKSKAGLHFQTTNGYSYQVQSIPALNSRFWRDACPVFQATGELTAAVIDTTAGSGFFRVLEWSDSAFWYDWSYYEEAPLLRAWGLGARQEGYGHNDRPYEWYIDQADTGNCSENNCGPASAIMALRWYDPTCTKTAEEARNRYPASGGWWYTSDVLNYLSAQRVPVTTSSFVDADQLVEAIDAGYLAILCFNTAYLTCDETDEHRVGRFYGYASGHIVVVKGWRRVSNVLYFELYDPNNWHATYSDKTPKGRNRHFQGLQLAQAVRTWWPYFILVHPPGQRIGALRAEVWLRPVDPQQIAHQGGM
jgi:hypothetical protein